jgi:hypothetical protein
MNMTTWRPGADDPPSTDLHAVVGVLRILRPDGLIVSSEISRNAVHRMDPFLWTAIEIAVSALPGLASLWVALRAIRRGR